MHKIMSIAKVSSELSKDTTKVGCVAVSTEGRIIAVGVNGYPPGYDDSNLSYKYEKVIHAEINALINSRAVRGEVHSLYIYGLPPCKDCMKFIAAFGVKEVNFFTDKSIKSHKQWVSSYLEHAHLHPLTEFIEHE
jgi:dCMP deaminase